MAPSLRQLLEPPYLWWISGPRRAELLAAVLSPLLAGRDRTANAAGPAGRCLEKWLTRPLRLIDVRAYRQLAGLAEGESALNHYLRQGDRQGLAPNAWFDPAFYDAQAGVRPLCNRLLHYALIGRHRGWQPSPHFDPTYYLHTYPDVAAAAQDPLAHFLRRGRYEGRQPSAETALLRRRATGIDERVVRASGPLTPILATRAASTAPTGECRLPADADDPLWRELTGRAPSVTDAGLIVAVPVYGSRQHTLRCLYSVLRAATTIPFQLLVIDDASPEPELSRDLQRLADRGLFELRRHERNLGFTATANEAIAHNEGVDLVLLNADTQVFDHWLDRLAAAAQRHRETASFTPLSNNATIASYPHWLQSTPIRSDNGRYGVDPAAIDMLAARANRHRSVTVPTGVGFCLYLRRSALRQVGGFDVRAFGRGYGEEVDWCRRAVAAGWQHRLASDVYVAHTGGVSFSRSSERRNRRAQRLIERRHPGYRAGIRSFIAHDPVFPERARIDLEHLRPQMGEHNLLQIAHGRGGGVERCLGEQRRQAEAAGWGVFELRPSHRPDRVSLEHPAVDGTPNLWEIDLLHHGPSLADLLEGLRIRRLQLHHRIDLPADIDTTVLNLRERLGADLEIWLHDFHLLCPRVNLFDPSLPGGGAFCGMPRDGEERERCRRCLAADDLLASTGAIEAWRARSAALLIAADRLIAPSQDTAARFQAIWPDLSIEVRPHDDPAYLLAAARLATTQRKAAPRQREPVRVLVLGAISPAKGFHLVQALAQANQGHPRPPLEFGLLGAASDEEALGRTGVRLLGRYRDSEVQESITAADPDVILIPSLWPETHCYALSHALASGRPVAAFDLGAQGERLRQWLDQGQVRLLPPPGLLQVSSVVAVLEALRDARDGDQQTAKEHGQEA